MEEVDFPILKKRAISGVIALTSRTFLLQLISAFSFFLLSIFLSPSVIGVYIAVTAIMRIVSFFTDFGLGAAIVQKRDKVSSDDLKTAFSLQVTVTFLIFIIFFLLRNNLQIFFHLSPDGQKLLLVLIFTLFLSSFKIIPSVLLERSLKFDRLIIPQIVESLVFNIIVVLLAYKGFGVASFTWSTLASATIGIPFYFLVYPWIPKFGFSMTSAKMLFYAVTFQAKSILGTLKDDLLTVFLTRLLPYSQIGLIGWGQKWSFFSFRFLVDSITKVSFSAYSRLQHDLILLRNTLEKSLFTVSILIFPIQAGIILTASYFLKFFPAYQKWEGALISLYFFSLNACVSSLSGILVNTLDATGHVKTTLKLMVMWTILTWVLTPLLIYFIGYNGVALASFLVTLTIGVTVFLVKKIVDFNFLSSFFGPLVASLIMASVVFIFNKLFVTSIPLLFISIIIGITIYSLALWFIAKRQILDIVQLVKK